MFLSESFSATYALLRGLEKPRFYAELLFAFAFELWFFFINYFKNEILKCQLIRKWKFKIISYAVKPKQSTKGKIQS